jgi:preprotein translocase subunit SecD
MNRTYRLLIPIILILLIAIYIDIPGSPGIHGLGFNRAFTDHLGLDLVGGVQALLEADVPANTTVSAANMAIAKQIVENRVNALGVTEPLVQQAGTNRIVVELPGETDPATALAVIKETGLLEFVDMTTLTAQQAQALVGTKIKTDYTGAGSQPSTNPTTIPITPGSTSQTPEISLTPSATPTTTITSTLPVQSGPTYHTVMTGANLKNVQSTTNSIGAPIVAFQLNSDGAKIFGDFTKAHISQILGIALDKVVISTPAINNAITSGSGTITGNFTRAEADKFTVQLQSGSLPVPLKVITSSTVGPTLGQDSLNRSLVAGLIGMSVVILFMALYYRLPGLVADLALLCYALITYALFRWIPVTLTLPGIAGFILSVGVAVDANVLIFERLKEELRSGKSLKNSIDLGWKNAWPSIRDSNFSTLITCGILFYFGYTFGASIVKGFSLTLAIGVGVSMFTAIVVTRTFLHVILDRINFTQHTRWFGL